MSIDAEHAIRGAGSEPQPIHLDEQELALKQIYSGNYAGAAASIGGVGTNPELVELAAVRSRQSMLYGAGDGAGEGASKEAENDTPESVSEPEPEFPVVSTLRAFLIIFTVTASMSLSGAGGMALSIALPAIQTDLDVSEEQLQWVSSAFSLTNGCFLLLSGRIADIYGRKAVFIAGLFFNFLWSLIGGFMPNFASLIVTRALAGVGSAFTIPASVGIIASSFGGRRRTTAFACFSAGGPLGGGLGLIIGGLLTAYTDKSWRAALWCFAGLAGMTGIASFFVVLPDRHLDPDRRFDYVGATLITIGLVLLQFAIADASSASNGWKTGYIIALIIISVILIVAFFSWEYYVEHKTSLPPLMRLALWTRSRGRLAATYIVGFLFWMGFQSILYNATLFYQQVQNTGTIGAMLRFLPTTIAGLIVNVIVAQLVHRVNNQLLIAIGVASTGVANILFANAKVDSVYWGYAFNGMWLGVLGADFLMAVGSIFVSTLALPEEQSVAGATFNTMIQIGGALGLVFASVITSSISNKELKRGSDQATARIKGIHAAFYLGAGWSFASLIIVLVVLRGIGKAGGKRSKPKPPASDTSASLDRSPVSSPTVTAKA